MASLRLILKSKISMTALLRLEAEWIVSLFLILYYYYYYELKKIHFVIRFILKDTWFSILE